MLSLTAALALVATSLFVIARRHSVRSSRLCPASREPLSRPAGPPVTLPAPVPATSVSEDAIASARAELERQLDGLARTITRYIESNDLHYLSMAQAQSELQVPATLEQIRAVVERLVLETAKAQRDTRELQKSLEDSRTQTATIRQHLADAEARASLDQLTGLANRGAFDACLDAAVTKSHTDGTPLCLALCDLDFFKKVNDAHGHPTGDAVLKHFAHLLSSHVKSRGMPARYGGEEFAIVLPGTTLGTAYALVEGLRATVSSTTWPHHDPRRTIGKLTASFGIAEVGDGEPPSSLVSRADEMLYLAKRRGRNRTEVDGVTNR